MLSFLSVSGCLQGSRSEVVAKQILRKDVTVNYDRMRTQ